LYNPRGQRSLVLLGNGIMVRYLYNPHTFRLIRLRIEPAEQPAPLTWVGRGPTTVVQDNGYSYDLVGNLIALADRTPSSGIARSGPGARTFSYDPLYRLLTATGRESDLIPSPPWLDVPRGADLTRTRAYTESYAYDSSDNLLALTHQASAGYTRTYTLAPGGDRIAAMTIGASVFPYTYDPVGNLLVEATVRRFEWDHANRCSTYRTQTEGAEPSVYAQYRYAADGERICKVVRKQGGQTATTIYIDGFFQRLIVAERTGYTTHDSIHILDAANLVAIVRRGALLPNDPSPRITYHLGDHLGSITTVVDAAGAMVNREEYTPYGETSFGSYAKKRYRFTAKERDEESGLYYHGARYYAPWLGRWISRDPAGRKGGASLYAYVSNNPLRYVDDLGLEESEPRPIAPVQPKVDLVPARPAPPTGINTELYEYKDQQGNVTKRQVGLKDPEKAFVKYHDNCYSPAKSALSLLTSKSVIEGKYLMQPDHPHASSIVYPPRLVTYTAFKDNADGTHMDLTFDPGRTREVLNYTKSAIDAGRPVIVGVNENSLIAKDPRTGIRINKGIVGHYLLIVGYQEVVQNGRWVVNELYGMDNATGRDWLSKNETWPTFTLGVGGAVVKPASNAHPHYADEASYSIAEARVYAEDFHAVKGLDAWFGPRDRLVPIP
jgi:RHS repeat-associated protein